MTKRLDPEIRALRAMFRALVKLDERTQARVIDYWYRRRPVEQKKLVTSTEQRESPE